MAERAAARGAKERQTRRACKRTAAQDKHAEEDELPVLGLYVPCAMAWRCAGRRVMRKVGRAGC